jgi:hypothetical protein
MIDVSTIYRKGKPPVMKVTTRGSFGLDHAFPADEKTIHVAVYQFLCAVLPGAKIWHTPNGGERSKAEAVQFKKLGVLAGVPDLIILTKCGRMLFVEVKTQAGRLSADQIAFRDFCIAARVPHAVVRSVEETRNFLASHGVQTREAA